MSDETYAYIDFAVVIAPQIDVLRAAAALRSDYAAAATAAHDRPGAGEARGAGMLRRVGETAKTWLRKPEPPVREPDPTEAPPLFLHCDDGAELDRLITWTMEEETSGIPPETRISALAMHPGWTMVEYADPMSGMSYTAMNLSTD
ncbi:MAG: hypothetical protein AAGB15_15085, partial [Pseudomonadota bacterium]